MEDFKSLIQPVWRFSAIYIFSWDCSTGDREYTFYDLGFVLEISLILFVIVRKSIKIFLYKNRLRLLYI